MARVRDYKAEYARRIERGLARGLTRSQAAGHPKAGEAHISPQAVLPKYDRRLEEGLKSIRKGKTLGKAAQSISISPERLRHYIMQTGVVEKQRARWKVMHDARPRHVLIYSKGHVMQITVPGYEAAALVGRYMAAVKAFLETNDPRMLEPFVGETVTDVNGKKYVFETHPNTLYRLTTSTTESFEEVYQIVV